MGCTFCREGSSRQDIPTSQGNAKVTEILVEIERAAAEAELQRIAEALRKHEENLKTQNDAICEALTKVDQKAILLYSKVKSLTSHLGDSLQRKSQKSCKQCRELCIKVNYPCDRSISPTAHALKIRTQAENLKKHFNKQLQCVEAKHSQQISDMSLQIVALESDLKQKNALLLRTSLNEDCGSGCTIEAFDVPDTAMHEEINRESLEMQSFSSTSSLRYSTDQGAGNCAHDNSFM